jgi:hypothetical protein
MRRNLHLLIDDRKLWTAQAVLAATDLPTVRSKSLANLGRWKSKGTWGGVYDEWWHILTTATDDELIKIMTGTGDEPNRLRQSPPYVGILDEITRLKIYVWYQEAVAANGHS